MDKAQKYYNALDQRWQQERAAGCEPPESHRKIALKALAAGDAACIASLGRASNDRRIWQEMRIRYQRVEEAAANRFRRGTDPGIRELYGQEPLNAAEYAWAYREAMRIIRDGIDEPIYIDWLFVQYQAEAHRWLKTYLRSLWRKERPNTTVDHLTLDLDLLSPATLVGLCTVSELRIASGVAYDR